VGREEERGDEMEEREGERRRDRVQEQGGRWESRVEEPVSERNIISKKRI
jgi:hypothetical protein